MITRYGEKVNQERSKSVLYTLLIFLYDKVRGSTPRSINDDQMSK